MPWITINSEPPKPTTFEDLGYVKVVRCKDCYFGEHTINLAGERCVQCTNSDLGMMGDCHTPNWFCADGERK